ncbi:hypothetical protein I4U23_003583 [Adineta vaga]|nr:hypothetical protein I4U23_003583 [Adineta vaga]
MIYYFFHLLILVVVLIFGIIIGNFGMKGFQRTSIMIATNDISNKDLKTYSVSTCQQSLSSSSQRNLVITAALDLDLITMYRFSRSLRASCNSCQLTMIVKEATMHNNDFRELANLYSIVYISEKEYFPKRLRMNRAKIPYIYSTRWLIIHNYLSTLQAKGEVYDNVFMCDSHDTLFQTNVFRHMTSYTPGLFVFMESKHMTIGKCFHNSDWIKTCFSDAELTKLFNYPISCSGTVLGTWSAVLSYLSMMESHIISTSVACKKYGGSDQGIHNYIIHNNKLVNVTVHRILHEYGFVGTLGHASLLKRNQFGLVVNENGSIYAVIHQWNRSQQMKTQIQREYHLISADIRDKKN